MKIFRASQPSVVLIEAVLTLNQSPVSPAKTFGGILIQWSASTVCHSLSDISRLLCKNSYKSNSLQGFFDCFLSNHTVGCRNINFSRLSQIRREKFCCASNVSIFLLYFLRDCSCLDATFGQLFTLRAPIFLLAPLFMLIAWWKTIFFECSWVIIEKGTEKEKFSG